MNNARVTSATPLRSSLDRDAFAPMDWGLFSAMGLIWGSSFLLIKVGLESFSPGVITLGRVGLGALALLLLRRRPVRVAPADRGRIVLLSVLWVGIPFTLYPLAEQHITSSLTGLLTGATPFFTGLFGALWVGRPSPGPQNLGIAVGFVGIALISAASSAEGGSAPWGVVLVLAATACYGLAANLAGPLLHKYGSVRLMGLVLGLGTLWTTPFGLAGLSQSQWRGAPVVATAILGVVGTGLAFVLMATLVGRVGAPRASFITYLIPVVALVMGAIFLGESVTPMALVGAGLVVAASVLASRAET